MEMTWFGHATMRVFTFGQTILVDPVRANARLETTFKPDQEPKATVVLITSDKADHCEPETVRLAADVQARIIAPRGSMKSLLRARRRDAQYAIAKPEEKFPVNEHLRIRSLGTPEGYDPGIIYVVESSETVVFLGDALMTPAHWSYAAGDVKPNVIVYPPHLVRKHKERGEMFRQWVAQFGTVSCIPVHYHSSPHADAVYFIDQEELPKTVPDGARLELLSNRPLVAKETRRMRRRV